MKRLLSALRIRAQMVLVWLWSITVALRIVALRVAWKCVVFPVYWTFADHIHRLALEGKVRHDDFLAGLDVEFIGFEADRYDGYYRHER